MKKFTGPYAGMAEEILSNHSKHIELLKKMSESYYGLKAQPGKFIPFLRPKQLAQQLSVSLKTLERMRKDGSGPPFKKICNGTVRYSIVELEKWLGANTFPPPPIAAAALTSPEDDYQDPNHNQQKE